MGTCQKWYILNYELMLRNRAVESQCGSPDGAACGAIRESLATNPDCAASGSIRATAHTSA